MRRISARAAELESLVDDDDDGDGEEEALEEELLGQQLWCVLSPTGRQPAASCHSK